MAVQKASQTKKARTKDLWWVVNKIVGRERRGLGRVRLAYVAADIGSKGNEEANSLAKEATDEEVMIPEIIERSLKQN